MSSTLYTGVTNHNQISGYNYNTNNTVAAGATRWNATNSTFEMFDGTNWKTVMDGRNETMMEMVQHLEDRLTDVIEEEYKDNVTLQDAYKTWEEATQRFKVIVALTENK